MKHPVIYDYLDYRAYLNDMFTYKKQTHKNFSYRFFSRKSGFASPNFLKLVTNNQRNLTNESISKVAKGFDLSVPEREFFENLVFMNQAPTHDERNYYYKRMMSAKGYHKARKLDKDGYEYFSKWYYPVIRELITFGDRNQTPKEIAAMLHPPITPKEAEKALSLLINLGLIYQDGDNKWVQSEKTISTGPEVNSIIVTNFHKEMLHLANESLDSYSANERDITALTLSVNSNTILEIKQRIDRLRKELLEMACNDKDANQVIQINFQVFPLSKQA